MADVGVKHKQSVTHRLYLHELSSTIGLGQNSDLLLSKDGFPHLEQGDLVQLFVPEAPSQETGGLRRPYVSYQGHFSVAQRSHLLAGADVHGRDQRYLFERDFKKC